MSMAMIETAIPRPENAGAYSNKCIYINKLCLLRWGCIKQCAAICSLVVSFTRCAKPIEGHTQPAKGEEQNLSSSLRDRANLSKTLGLPATVFLIIGVAAPTPIHAAMAQRHESAKARQATAIPLCTGATPSSSPGVAVPAGSPHSVTLSWEPSVPRSHAAKDAIKGYYVYRSLASHAYPESSRLNSVTSDFSDQITVVVPSP